MDNEFSCPKCKYSQTTFFDVCPSCQVVLRKLADPPRRTIPANETKKKSEKTKTRQIIFITIAFPTALAAFLGQVHVIRGSTYDGPLLAKKYTFGYSETFINTDEILNMPVIGAKSQYPLSVKALQNIGFLESDEAYEERVQRDIQKIVEQYKKDPFGAISSRSSDPPVVTLTEYEEIREGMTYEQVKGIIGAPGQELSRSDFSGYTTVMYSWTNPNGSNMNAMFQNGRSVRKAQFGLR